MMTPMIDENDTLELLLPAKMIPDGAQVFAIAGSRPFTMRQGLKVYPVPKTNGDIVDIKGCFIVGDKGTINQVDPDRKFRWEIKADDLVAVLSDKWQTEADERESK